jgi:hypothetical protein
MIASFRSLIIIGRSEVRFRADSPMVIKGPMVIMVFECWVLSAECWIGSRPYLRNVGVHTCAK